jgi:hypothetical protein
MMQTGMAFAMRKRSQVAQTLLLATTWKTRRMTMALANSQRYALDARTLQLATST